MSCFSILDYSFPLNTIDLIKYLNENGYSYKNKNNIYAITLKNKLSAFAICDNEYVKYIKIRFLSLEWNEKNKLVNQLEKRYSLLSYSISTNTRIYKEYNISFMYSDVYLLEATFHELTKEEEKLKEKLSKKLNSSIDSMEVLRYIIEFIGSSV